MARADLFSDHLVRVFPDWEFNQAPPRLVTACRLMPLRVRLFAEMWTGDLPGSAPGSGGEGLAAG